MQSRVMARGVTDPHDFWSTGVVPTIRQKLGRTNGTSKLIAKSYAKLLSACRGKHKKQVGRSGTELLRPFQRTLLFSELESIRTVLAGPDGPANQSEMDSMFGTRAHQLAVDRKERENEIVTELTERSVLPDSRAWLPFGTWIYAECGEEWVLAEIRHSPTRGRTRKPRKGWGKDHSIIILTGEAAGAICATPTTAYRMAFSTQNIRRGTNGWALWKYNPFRLGDGKLTTQAARMMSGTDESMKPYWANVHEKPRGLVYNVGVKLEKGFTDHLVPVDKYAAQLELDKEISKQELAHQPTLPVVEDSVPEPTPAPTVAAPALVTKRPDETITDVSEVEAVFNAAKGLVIDAIDQVYDSWKKGSYTLNKLVKELAAADKILHP